MNYNKFKECLCVNKHNICQVGPYKIEVVLDDTRTESRWQQLEFVTKKELKICMCNPHRSVKELLFDFYREVGRINLYEKLIDVYKADKYYDRNKLIAPRERQQLVEDMTLDEWACIQMDYNLTPNIVLPFMNKNQMKVRYIHLNDKDIEGALENKNAEILMRRDYLTWVIKNKDKHVKSPKRLKSKETDAEEAISSHSHAYEPKISNTPEDPLKTPKPVIKKPIRIIASKMNLSEWTDNFDDNVKHIIKVYTKPDEEISVDDFVLKTKEYIPLDDEPDDWGTPSLYYRGTPQGYQSMKKPPQFSPGIYFKLVEHDARKIIKELYDQYRHIVTDFLVRYYDNYRKSFSITDRDMYRYIIENGMRNFIELKQYPDKDEVEDLKKCWYAKNNQQPIKLTAHNSGNEMLTYKERRNLLQQAIKSVAEKHNIENYKIDDGYELNNAMNTIVEKYRNNDSHLDTWVLPYIIRSSV